MYRSFINTILNKHTLRASWFRETPKPIGRWAIDKSNTSVSMTNYYNNVDHCGTGDYQTQMIESILKEKQKEETKKDE